MTLLNKSKPLLDGNFNQTLGKTPATAHLDYLTITCLTFCTSVNCCPPRWGIERNLKKSSVPHRNLVVSASRPKRRDVPQVKQVTTTE
jgi:hypothetical protein